MGLTVYAPATSANLNVGFDVLGLALKPLEGGYLGDHVELIERAEGAPEFELKLRGRFAQRLPPDPELNVVTSCWRHFKEALSARGEPVKPVQLTLYKELPVGSGLGSSACSVVAALLALNIAHGAPLSEAELLRLMGTLEGSVSGSVHYDNVAPSYLGGLQLIMGEGEPLSYTLPHFAEWRWVLCYPGTSLSTSEARGALPSAYPLSDCLSYGRSLAGFVHACHVGDEGLAARLMRDVIAEPYRAPLIQGLGALRAYEAEREGVLASGISGAGPTLFGVARTSGEAEALEAWMRDALIQGPEGFTLICELDPHGAREVRGETR